MIPFLDLGIQYRNIKQEINEAVLKVLAGCRYALGPEVVTFEKEFAGYCQAQAGVAVNSGTSALHLALLAGNVGFGDEVITTPHTFVATVAAIIYSGATPVFVDIAPETMNMDVAAVAGVITPRTKAIIPVHLYGQPVDMDPLMELAHARGLVVIEDACQAHGAEYKGRRVGSIGDFGCFSFYPGKNLGAYGEGGFVATNDEKYAHTIRMLRDWGAEQKYEHILKGYNYRMDNIQGAVLRVKLKYLDEWTEARRKNAAVYDSLLADSCVRLPKAMEFSRHVYHVYAIRTLRRDELLAYLAKRDIYASIHYPTPVHLLPAYSDLGYERGSFPEAEKVTNEVLSLPMYPELTEPMVQEVANGIEEFCKGQAS